MGNTTFPAIVIRYTSVIRNEPDLGIRSQRGQMSLHVEVSLRSIVTVGASRIPDVDREVMRKRR